MPMMVTRNDNDDDVDDDGCVRDWSVLNYIEKPHPFFADFKPRASSPKMKMMALQRLDVELPLSSNDFAN